MDSLIEDLNNAVKLLTNGNYIGWCSLNVLMVQKLSNLKKGIASDLKNRDETINTLKSELRKAGAEVIDIPVEKLEKDGVEHGGN